MSKIDFFKMLFLRRKCNNIALIENEISISYAQLYKLICINSKRNLGDKKFVGIYMENSIEFIIAFLSIIAAGKIVVPIDIRMKENEIKNIMNLCDIEDIFISNNKLNSFSENMNVKFLTVYMNYECNNTFEIFVKKEKTIVAMLSSGTTDKCKIVPMNYENIMYRIFYTEKYYERNFGDKELIVLPLSSVIGNQQQMLTALYKGIEIYIYKGIFLPNKIFSIINKKSINYISLVPSMLRVFLEYIEKNTLEMLLLDKIFIAGEKVEKNILKKALKYLKNTHVVQGYGMTEMAPISIIDYKETENLDSVGKPLESTKILIVNDLGEECEIKEKGEILVNDKHMVTEYLFEERTKREWLHTGDIGFLDEKNFLYLCGRKKNIAIVNGNNIQLEEVEGIILAYDDIIEAQLLVEYDNEKGEYLLAKIVPKKERKINLESLLVFCNKNLASYKIPKKFEIVKELKKSNSFKTKR